jgi:hypothetical protein
MTPEAQRIAIAAACPGWRVGDEFGMSSLVHWTDGHGTRMLSDPISDLNAMHEAEKTLQHYGYYVDRLAGVMDLPRGTFCTAGATAAQRAEAFLRTIGKWEEDK